MQARVTVGARLHFGFANLSLARERLYGGLGVALDAPRLVVEARPAGRVECADATAREHVETAVDLLGLPGAAVRVVEALPRHVGLGSGTGLALAVLAAVARSADREPRVRERAPAFGRGGRSGVGVATFEAGGFVLDAGHPTAQFTPEPPAVGTWQVPPVAARHDVPPDWRFVLVRPDVPAGRDGAVEDASLRRAIERADPAIADAVAGRVLRGVLPGVAGDDPAAFGRAVAAVGRHNGAWYADVQGGVYRPPVGAIVEALDEHPAVYGAGQSSWGPTVFGVTERDRADEAERAGEAALDAAGETGAVRVVGARNRGATVELADDGDRTAR